MVLKQPSTFGLQSDGIRRERCAFVLAVEMRRQLLAMRFCFDPDLLQYPGLPFYLPESTSHREISSYRLQLLPAR